MGAVLIVLLVLFYWVVAGGDILAGAGSHGFEVKLGFGWAVLSAPDGENARNNGQNDPSDAADSFKPAGGSPC